MRKIYLIKFMIYGIIGWCLEIMWTGFWSLASGDAKLTATTYLWMFPIYGLVVVFEPIFDKIILLPLWARGVLYTVLIFLTEYITGGLIREITGQVPWDYTTSAYNIHGLIRLDFAPVWFVTGLIYEKLHLLIDYIICGFNNKETFE